MLNNLKSISVNARLLSALLCAITQDMHREYLHNIYLRNHPKKGIELVATDGHIMLVGYDPLGEMDVIDPNRLASIFKFHIDSNRHISKTTNELLRKVQSIAKKKGETGNARIHLAQSEDHVLSLENNGRLGILDVAPGMAGDGVDQWDDAWNKCLDCLRLGNENYDNRLDPSGEIAYFSHYTLAKLSELQTYCPRNAISFIMRGDPDKDGKVNKCLTATIAISNEDYEEWRIIGLIMPFHCREQILGSLDYEADLSARFRNGDKQPEQTADERPIGQRPAALPPEQSETETELESVAEQSVPPVLDPSKLGNEQ